MNLRLNIFTIFLKKKDSLKTGGGISGLCYGKREDQKVRDPGSIPGRDPAGPNTIVEEPQIIEIITKLPSRENYLFYCRIVGGLVPKQNV